MYKVDRSFHPPSNETIVWRYLDFTKFMDLLISQKLFFCRSDKFEDPFEGIFKLKDHVRTQDMFQSMPETKKFYFINSWHINETQSAAMWKIFVKNNNGIAIKSTVSRIISSFENTKDEVYAGQIYYRDFEKVTYKDLQAEPQNQYSDNSGGVNQFNYKRISFEHEKELRLYHIDTPIPHTMKEGTPRAPLEFKKIDVDLIALIDSIVVAPFAEPWFLDLIISVTKKLNFDFQITQSDLYKS